MRILSAPSVYWLSQVVLGGPGRHADFVHKHIRPEAGMRVLDIGLRPRQHPQADARHGVRGSDLNPHYIEQAKKRYGDVAEFSLRRRDPDRAQVTGNSTWSRRTG